MCQLPVKLKKPVTVKKGRGVSTQQKCLCLLATKLLVETKILFPLIIFFIKMNKLSSVVINFPFNYLFQYLIVCYLFKNALVHNYHTCTRYSCSMVLIFDVTISDLSRDDKQQFYLV